MDFLFWICIVIYDLWLVHCSESGLFFVMKLLDAQNINPVNVIFYKFGNIQYLLTQDIE